MQLDVYPKDTERVASYCSTHIRRFTTVLEMLLNREFSCTSGPQPLQSDVGH